MPAMTTERKSPAAEMRWIYEGRRGTYIATRREGCLGVVWAVRAPTGDIVTALSFEAIAGDVLRYDAMEVNRG